MNFFRSFLFKYLRFFVAGLAVLLIIESGALIYFDRSVLQEKTNVTVEKVKQEASSKPVNLKVNLDESARDINASYEGNFISYTKDDSLYVLNLTNGKNYKVSMDEDMQYVYCRWVYDRDQLIIAEKPEYGYYAKLYNLDTRELGNGGKPVEIRNTVRNTSAKITLKSKYSKITDMDFSTSTVTTYLKISNKYGKDVLWKFNVPDQNRAYTSINASNIGNIQCLKNESELLYENKDNGHVNIVGLGSLQIDGGSQFRLLGFDGSDNVYLSKGSSDKTDTIYYGSLVNADGNGEMEATLTPEMKKQTLSSKINISDIYIMLSGSIYQNDTAKSVFRNIVTGKETAYTGKVISVYGSGFLTVNNNLLQQNNLE